MSMTPTPLRSISIIAPTALGLEKLLTEWGEQEPEIAPLRSVTSSGMGVLSVTAPSEAFPRLRQRFEDNKLVVVEDGNRWLVGRPEWQAPAPTKPLVDCLVDYLNKQLKADPEALHALVEYRVLCGPNSDAADYVAYAESEDGPSLVGMLGIINGFLRSISETPISFGPIGAGYDDAGRLETFAVVTRPLRNKEQTNGEQAVR